MRRREQRQVVGQPRRRRAALVAFQGFQHRLGAGDDGRRQARQPRDVDAVRTVGGAGSDFVQEYRLAPPLAHPHGVAGEIVQPRGKARELVVVRREQGAATVHRVQVLDRRPGNGEAVERGRAAADLVENDQRARPRLVEDRRRFDHLHHEGRATARQIVRRADAAEQAVHDADPASARRHVAAGLREDRDQRVLTQERALAGHIGSGQQPQAAAGGQLAVVGDEFRRRRSLRRRLDHGMAAAGDREIPALVDLGPTVIALDGKGGAGRRHVDLGNRGGGGGDVVRARRRLADQIVEQLELHRQRAVRGARDPVGEVGKLRRREPHRAGHRLAVDEPVVAEQPLAAIGTDFDEIPEHVVVLDLERGDAGPVRVLRLQGADEAPALVAQRMLFVERGDVAAGDEAAVAREQGQVGGERAGQPVDEHVVDAEAGDRVGEAVGKRCQSSGTVGEVRPQGIGGAQRVAQRGEVARTAAADAQAPERALDVAATGKQIAYRFARLVRGDEERHHVEPHGNGCRVGRGSGEARREQTSAGRRSRAVHDVEKAAAATAVERPHELEIAPRRRVDGHHGAVRLAPQRCEARPLPLLGEIEIVDKGPGGGDLGAVEVAERVERGDAVDFAQAARRGGRVEAHRRQHGRRTGPIGKCRFVGQRLGSQQLPRRDLRQQGGERRGRRCGDREAAGRHVEPRDAPGAVGPRYRRQMVVCARVEQAVFDESPRSDEADHVARNRALGAALARRRGVFRLLADRHLETGADEPLEIGFVAVSGHAAHGNLAALVPAPAGQRDAQRRGRAHRIVEEHLVEVAHAIEEQRVRVLALDLEILGHHRRRFGRAPPFRRLGSPGHGPAVRDPAPLYGTAAGL